MSGLVNRQVPIIMDAVYRGHVIKNWSHLLKSSTQIREKDRSVSHIILSPSFRHMRSFDCVHIHTSISVVLARLGLKAAALAWPEAALAL